MRKIIIISLLVCFAKAPIQRQLLEKIEQYGLCEAGHTMSNSKPIFTMRDVEQMLNIRSGHSKIMHHDFDECYFSLIDYLNDIEICENADGFYIDARIHDELLGKIRDKCVAFSYQDVEKMLTIRSTGEQIKPAEFSRYYAYLIACLNDIEIEEKSGWFYEDKAVYLKKMHEAIHLALQGMRIEDEVAILIETIAELDKSFLPERREWRSEALLILMEQCARLCCDKHVFADKDSISYLFHIYASGHFKHNVAAADAHYSSEEIANAFLHLPFAS